MLIDNKHLINDNDLMEVTGCGEMNTNTEWSLPISAGLKDIIDISEYYTPAYNIGNNPLYESMEKEKL